MMSDHVEQADEEPVQGQSAVTPTPSVSYTGEGNTRKGYGPSPNAIPAADATGIEELQALRRALEEERLKLEAQKEAQRISQDKIDREKAQFEREKFELLERSSEMEKERYSLSQQREELDGAVVDDVLLPDAGYGFAVEPRAVVAQDLCSPRLVSRGIGSVVDLYALVGAYRCSSCCAVVT